LGHGRVSLWIFKEISIKILQFPSMGQKLEIVNAGFPDKKTTRRRGGASNIGGMAGVLIFMREINKRNLNNLIPKKYA
jgi:hypothetical protein